jgi:ribosomal protein L35
MPKIKTHKSSAKRFKFSNPKKKKSSKTTHRRAGQNHFNARESGIVTKRKRRSKQISSSVVKTVRMLSGK